MRYLLSLWLVSGCGPSQADADRDRFRQALVQAPMLAHPEHATKIDHTPSGSWDSSFTLESYSHMKMCVLAEWNVPADVAPNLKFELAGWPTLDGGARAPKATSASIEILDAVTLENVKRFDVFVGAPNAKGESTSLVSERPDKERAMYETAMRVCWNHPSEVLAQAQFMVITVVADEHHRTAAGWHLR